MKTNAELDKWAAEKCGVSIANTLTKCVYHFKHNKKLYYFDWTLSDARCREIVREYFKVRTGNMNESEWFCSVIDSDIYSEGKSIEAAEIACIQAIKAAEGE